MPINSSPRLGCRPRGPHIQIGRKALFIARRAVSLHLLEYPQQDPCEACIPEQNSMIFEWRTGAATVLNSPRQQLHRRDLRSIAVVEDCWMLSVNVGCAGNAPDADFLSRSGSWRCR